jgi:hypothetical protein
VQASRAAELIGHERATRGAAECGAVARRQLGALPREVFGDVARRGIGHRHGHPHPFAVAKNVGVVILKVMVVLSELPVHFFLPLFAVEEEARGSATKGWSGPR